MAAHWRSLLPQLALPAGAGAEVEVHQSREAEEVAGVVHLLKAVVEGEDHWSWEAVAEQEEILRLCLAEQAEEVILGLCLVAREEEAIMALQSHDSGAMAAPVVSC